MASALKWIASPFPASWTVFAFGSKISQRAITKATRPVTNWAESLFEPKFRSSITWLVDSGSMIHYSEIQVLYSMKHLTNDFLQIWSPGFGPPSQVISISNHQIDTFFTWSMHFFIECYTKVTPNFLTNTDADKSIVLPILLILTKTGRFGPAFADRSTSTHFSRYVYLSRHTPKLVEYILRASEGLYPQHLLLIS